MIKIIKNNYKVKDLQKRKNELHTLNIINHPMVGERIIIRGETWTVTNVLKKWKWGWYYAAEIECDKYPKNYTCVPFKNISSEDKIIMSKIKAWGNLK